MNKFENLNVWKKSMDLVEMTYKLMKFLPADERYGLISQIKRCSVSVPSNIAEGAGRNFIKRICSFFKYCKWINLRIRDAITFNR